MTDEEIVEELSNDRTLRVGDIWYFTGRYMTCGNTDGEYVCCEDSYATYEEALETIRSFHNKVEKL